MNSNLPPGTPPARDVIVRLACANPACPEQNREVEAPGFWELGATFLKDEEQSCESCGWELAGSEGDALLELAVQDPETATGATAWVRRRGRENVLLAYLPDRAFSALEARLDQKVGERKVTTHYALLEALRDATKAISGEKEIR